MSSAIFVGATFVDPGEESGTGWLSVMMGPNACVSKRLEDYTVRLGTQAGGRHGKLTRLKSVPLFFSATFAAFLRDSQRSKAFWKMSQRKRQSNHQHGPRRCRSGEQEKDVAQESCKFEPKPDPAPPFRPGVYRAPALLRSPSRADRSDHPRVRGN